MWKSLPSACISVSTSTRLPTLPNKLVLAGIVLCTLRQRKCCPTTEGSSWQVRIQTWLELSRVPNSRITRSCRYWALPITVSMTLMGFRWIWKYINAFASPFHPKAWTLSSSLDSWQLLNSLDMTSRVASWLWRIFNHSLDRFQCCSNPEVGRAQLWLECRLAGLALFNFWEWGPVRGHKQILGLGSPWRIAPL